VILDLFVPDVVNHKSTITNQQSQIKEDPIFEL